MEEYTNIIKAINDIIFNSDGKTWWPKIVRIEGNHAIHDIGGVEAGSSSNSFLKSYSDSQSNALLRLVLNDSLCATIFAYSVTDGIERSDIIVGFLNKDNKLTLAWDDKRVYPMIGQQSHTYNFKIPDDTVWIVAACLNTKPRRLVSLFGNTKTLSELEIHTCDYEGTRTFDF